MVAADAWTAIGGVGSALAAVAAGVAIWFAKATVEEARESRRDAEQAHEELLAQSRLQLESFAAAHREQMAQRAEALAAERRMEVIRQLQQIADVLLDLADCARDEAIHPPARLSEVSPIPLTRIPGLLATLRSVRAALAALHGPDLATVRALAGEGYNVGTGPIYFVRKAVDGLREVETAIASLE